MPPPFSVLVGSCVEGVSESLRVLIEHLLNGRFQLHLTARDSWQALASYADDHGYDLLLVNLTATTDHNRSGRTLGEMTAQNIRQFKSRYHKPIIILTTWDEPGLFPRLEAAGANAVIRMPFTLPDIVPHIDRCIGAATLGETPKHFRRPVMGWLAEKTRNFRIGQQIELTRESVRQMTLRERAYVLLSLSITRFMFEGEKPDIERALQSPASVPHGSLMNEFYDIEEVRNMTVSQLKQIKLQFGDRFPKQIERHMKHSADCLNVILATLGAGLVSKTEAVRDMWQMLADARAALPEAILDFREAIDVQSQLGDESARDSVPWEDAEWISRSSTIPRI